MITVTQIRGKRGPGPRFDQTRALELAKMHLKQTVIAAEVGVTQAVICRFLQRARKRGLL